MSSALETLLLLYTFSFVYSWKFESAGKWHTMKVILLNKLNWFLLSCNDYLVYHLIHQVIMELIARWVIAVLFSLIDLFFRGKLIQQDKIFFHGRNIQRLMRRIPINFRPIPGMSRYTDNDTGYWYQSDYIISVSVRKVGTFGWGVFLRTFRNIAIAQYNALRIWS